MIPVGTSLPSMPLASTAGGVVDLSRLSGTVVIYTYPRTSPPDQPLIEGWDLIPGARGCTPQSCAFRDHHADLKSAGASHVFGLSTQDTKYQREAADRLHLPFPLFSDADLNLTRELGLPTFEAGGMTLLKRSAWILTDGTVTHVLFPVPEPARNAEEVLAYLQGQSG